MQKKANTEMAVPRRADVWHGAFFQLHRLYQTLWKVSKQLPGTLKQSPNGRAGQFLSGLQRVEGNFL